MCFKTSLCTGEKRESESAKCKVRPKQNSKNLCLWRKVKVQNKNVKVQEKMRATMTPEEKKEYAQAEAKRVGAMHPE